MASRPCTDAEIDHQGVDPQPAAAIMDVANRVDDLPAVVVALPAFPHRLLVGTPARPRRVARRVLLLPVVIEERQLNADQLRGRRRASKSGDWGACGDRRHRGAVRATDCPAPAAVVGMRIIYGIEPTSRPADDRCLHLAIEDRTIEIIDCRDVEIGRARRSRRAVLVPEAAKPRAARDRIEQRRMQQIEAIVDQANRHSRACAVVVRDTERRQRRVVVARRHRWIRIRLVQLKQHCDLDPRWTDHRSPGARAVVPGGYPGSPSFSL